MSECFWGFDWIVHIYLPVIFLCTSITELVWIFSAWFDAVCRITLPPFAQFTEHLIKKFLFNISFSRNCWKEKKNENGQISNYILYFRCLQQQKIVQTFCDLWNVGIHLCIVCVWPKMLRLVAKKFDVWFDLHNIHSLPHFRPKININIDQTIGFGMVTSACVRSVQIDEFIHFKPKWIALRRKCLNIYFFFKLYVQNFKFYQTQR